MSWPTWIRIFSGAVALWSAIQITYLAITRSMSPPVSSAELVATHNDGLYTSFLVLHCIALVVFGVGAYRSGDLWHRIKKERLNKERRWWNETDKGSLTEILYYSLALAIFIISLVSIWVPRYETFVDLSMENVVRRDTYLLPPGVTQQTIPFGEVDIITGKFIKDRGDRGNIHYHYTVSIITRDGRRIEVGYGPRQDTNTTPAIEMRSLAEAIAEKSGARLDLR